MVKFYELYAGGKAVDFQTVPQSEDVMDKWILSRLHTLISEVTEYMDNYNVVKTSRSMMSFVDELSTWYLRRSRDRLRTADENPEAVAVFGYTLVVLAQLFAPFTPFFSEWVFHQLVDDTKSIHHTDWPVAQSETIHTQLEQRMKSVRAAVEKVHAARSEAGIRVRQPLASVTVQATTTEPKQNLLDVLKDEVNVKEVIWNAVETEETVTLDTTLTPELKAEGEAREVMRQIQKLRKQAGLSLGDTATVQVPEIPAGWQAEIEAKTNSKLTQGNTLELLTE